MNQDNTLAIKIESAKKAPSLKEEAFIKDINDAGYIELTPIEKAEIAPFLPQDFTNDQLNLALRLYPKVKSEDLEKVIDNKLESLPELTKKQKQTLYAPVYLMAAFEADDPHRSFNLKANFATEISISYVPETTPSTQNQIVFEKKEGGFQPLIRGITQIGTDFAKKKVKDFAVKAIEKGGKKLIKEAIKKGAIEGAKIATKAGVKAATSAVAQALGSIAPGPGNAVAFFLTEILPRIASFAKKILRGLNKIATLITGEEDWRKRLFFGAMVGTTLAAFLLGSPLAALVFLGLAAVTGAAIVGTGMVAIGATTATTFILATLGVIVGSFIIPLIVALTIITLAIVITLFIINTGAYVVPQMSPGLYDIYDIYTLTESPYVDIEKVITRPSNSGKCTDTSVSPGEETPFLECENGDLPLNNLQYTVTIKAKRGTLTNISMNNDCNVISDSTLNCPSPEPSSLPSLISPVNDFTFAYTASYNSSFQNSLVIDVFTITADVESEGVTQTAAAGSASVRIGEPPDQCPQGWPVGGRYNQGPYASSTHRNAEAVDIGANTGTSVSARHTGVARVTTGWPYGNNVEIVSNCPNEPFFSRYSHLSSVFVRSGDLVSLGTIIGEVGSTGNSLGPHLHYEFRGPSGPKGLNNPPNMLPPYVDQVITQSGARINPPRGCVGYAACGYVTVP